MPEDFDFGEGRFRNEDLDAELDVDSFLEKAAGAVWGFIAGDAIDLGVETYGDIRDGNYGKAVIGVGGVACDVAKACKAIAKAGKVLKKYGGRAADAVRRRLGRSPDVPNKTSSGIGTTKHGVQQKINREVRSADELDAIKNPLEVKPVKVDSMGRPSQRSIGRRAEVVRNPETGDIISVNPTSTKKAERLLRRLEDQ